MKTIKQHTEALVLAAQALDAAEDRKEWASVLASYLAGIEHEARALREQLELHMGD